MTEGGDAASPPAYRDYEGDCEKALFQVCIHLPLQIASGFCA